MEAGIDTSQLKILEDFFNDLSVVDERKIFLSAYKKAAMPLIATAKSMVPVERGNLWRSIGTKAIAGDNAIYVGTILNTPYITKKGKLSKVWYGHLTEGGFEKKGHKGFVEGKHWFRNALTIAGPVVEKIIEQEWYDSIERFIKRTNSRMK